MELIPKNLINKLNIQNFMRQKNKQTQLSLCQTVFRWLDLVL